jgi:hypothetical protein
MIRFTNLVLFILLVNAKVSFASYPSYYSHFYKGFLVLKGQTDTLRGYILLEPSRYSEKNDSISLPFDQFFDYGKNIVVYPDGTLGKNIRPRLISKEKIAFARLYYFILYPNPADTTEVWSLMYPFGVKTIQERQKIIRAGQIREYYTDFISITLNDNVFFLRKLYTWRAMVYDDFLNPEKWITSEFQLSNFLTPNYSSLFVRNRIFVESGDKIEEIPTNASFTFNFQRTRSVFKYVGRRYQKKFKRSDFETNRQMLSYITEHG